jgi:UTP--glucose-1-phosphate uridylyltransferase
MKITKAVIPAAGLGTRVLPATKALPKEMLPIVDKPAIQYIVEEAVASGITDILIITNRNKEIIENHFDKSPELENQLLHNNKTNAFEQISNISKLANIYFLRQKETLGLGHAVSRARSFVGNEPFAVLYGDDVIVGDDPACAQLIRAYEEFGRAVLGINQVSREDISKYSSLKVENIKENIFFCSDMVEKPAENEVLSLYSVLGRCILTPDIFEILDNVKPGVGGEIQLTDAMKILSNTVGMTAVAFTGTRYDMGNKLGIMKACVEVALKHNEIGTDFKKYLKSIANTL